MPEGAGLKTGPDRGQAGAAPEAAGLEAGPGRAHGRGVEHGDHARWRTEASVTGGDGERGREEGAGEAKTEGELTLEPLLLMAGTVMAGRRREGARSAAGGVRSGGVLRVFEPSQQASVAP